MKLKVIVPATVVSFLTLPAFAQEIVCNSDTLISCPGSCVERCSTDEAFFETNLAICAKIIRDQAADPGKFETSSCETTDAAARTTLLQCVSTARDIIRPPSGDEEIDEFLMGAPPCASTPYALTQMYNCLGAEADSISTLYGPLEARGYKIDYEPGEVGTLPSVCAIGRDQIDYDRLLADTLTDQSEALLTEFSAVSSCRRDWENWLNEASSNTTYGPSIDGIISIMQTQVGPAKEREVQIQGIVSGIDTQLANIKQVILSITLICPPDK